MKGLELCRAYFEAYGRPMLESEFSDVMDRIAVGLVGHGSECFGFDDEISQDHDFEPGFSLWLTDEDEKKFGFRLFRAYRKLPKTFMGITLKEESVFGSKTRGVHTITEFYSYYTGSSGAPETLNTWVKIPSFYLAEATNGEVFQDPLGEFSRIRQTILEGMPEDAGKKRLASSLFLMAQAGQYNVARCLKHGELGAASLALARFAENAIQVIYLLNRRFAPYYKWAFRALDSLSFLVEEGRLLEKTLSGPMGMHTVEAIEKIASGVIDCLIQQGYAVSLGDYLEPYAYHINETIQDGGLRTAPLIIS